MHMLRAHAAAYKAIRKLPGDCEVNAALPTASAAAADPLLLHKERQTLLMTFKLLAGPFRLVTARACMQMLSLCLWLACQLIFRLTICPGGRDVNVGIIHNVFWTEPKGQGWRYAHARWPHFRPGMIVGICCSHGVSQPCWHHGAT